MSLFWNPWDILISWLAQMDSSKREILLAVVALLVLFSVGTVGYALLEGWSVIDGFYMTFITLSTIGFQEVHPLSDLGRLLTFALGATGVGLLSFVAVRSAQLLFTSDRLRERRIMKRINNLSDHYIVCGYGRVGQRLTDDLLHEGTSVVVDVDEEVCSDLSEEKRLYVEGNAEEEETLRAAGIDRVRGSFSRSPRTAATCSWP